jgi:glycosyltransferase involved in cell wall biosynthesis
LIKLPLKIFITIPWFYPSYRAGGPVQSIVNLVNQYNSGVLYYIFTANKDLNDTSINVQEGKWVDFNPQTKVWYSSKNGRKKAFIDQFNAIQPDVLYINGMFSWHFTVVPLYFSKGTKKIISPRGMLHPEALGEKSFKKKLYFKLWKCFNLHKGVSFHATDHAEFEHIRSFFGVSTRVTVAPNFPRTFSYTPQPLKKAGQLKLISIGLISPMKNYLEVLTGLQNVRADVEYRIYGPVKDQGYWQQCVNVIERLPANIRVTFHGPVEPDHVKNVLEDSHVFILPSKSENFGHAIIEALSLGRPVITSYGTPWNKLKDNIAGVNVEPEPEKLASEISDFAMMTAELIEEYAKGATRYAQQSLDMEAVRLCYKKLFN